MKSEANQIAQPVPMPRARPQITWRQKSAVILFTIAIPILATNYWQHGGRITLFGVVPMPTLFLIACTGGAVSFFLWAQPRDRWFAAIPGAIAGLGGFGAHLFYTQWFERESLNSVESILIAAIGASPGLLMFWAVARIGKAKERSLAEAPKVVNG